MNDDALLAALGERITSLSPELIDLRRDLHAHPELSREETRTTDAVAACLETAGVAVRRLPGTGLVADLGAPEPTHRVALRADMDALPVTERSGLEWASRTEGVCHACGHDVHVAALVGALTALRGVEDSLTERGIAVRAVVQAAEEVMPGGALEAIEAGVLEGVDTIFAVHCDPSIDVGEVGLREGPLTAASDQLVVSLHGRGGHTSRPQLTEDLVYALAKVVTDVPAVLGRRLDPRTGAALVWGTVQAGRVANVIPSTGECRGTLRMLDAESWLTVGPLLEEIVHGVVQPYGVQAKVERLRGVPPVVNTADGISALRRAALASHVRPVPTAQSLGGEDFAWYLEHCHGAMARLGTRTPGGPTYDLHQGDLVVDERAVAHGARLLATAAVVRGLDARRAVSEDDA
ncbi:amidohydrolase [Phycicoccus endophyticus]|uniref:amidohydrolase n=2 Tax=Phycicoccus endophyticus TaxID=1690220 RepID=UPI0014093BD5|nr:amidohydrolase [Phycicoccus endophyticus]NHI20408.1 amidohydrolase [Phycicoccus endophyticus]GGL29470.1 amidohydrolase [Phycicoccus endophyticus]